MVPSACSGRNDAPRTTKIASGREGYHLHAFKLRCRHHGMTWTGDRHRDAAGRDVTLAYLQLRVRQRNPNEYDFGDLWEHDIRIEAKLEREGGKVYPTCIARVRAGPPGNIGVHQVIWRSPTPACLRCPRTGPTASLCLTTAMQKWTDTPIDLNHVGHPEAIR